MSQSLKTAFLAAAILLGVVVAVNRVKALENVKKLIHGA